MTQIETLLTATRSAPFPITIKEVDSLDGYQPQPREIAVCDGKYKLLADGHDEAVPNAIRRIIATAASWLSEHETEQPEGD